MAAETGAIAVIAVTGATGASGAAEWLQRRRVPGPLALLAVSSRSRTSRPWRSRACKAAGPVRLPTVAGEIPVGADEGGADA